MRSARPYFEKRDQLRKSQAEEIEALLRRHAENIHNDDIKQIITLRNTASNMLRSLDRLDPRDRGSYAERLKSAIRNLSEHIKNHDEDVEKIKRRLITQAQALIDSDPNIAIRQIRELQKSWQVSGQGRRRTDQEQWEGFRSACDAVFKKLDATRAEQIAKEATTLAETTAIVTELENFLTEFTAFENFDRARLQAIKLRWQNMGSSDRKLAQRYQTALQAIDKRRLQLQKEQNLARYRDADQAYRLIREVEHGVLNVNAEQTISQQLSTISSEFRSVLESRWQRMQANSETPILSEEALEQANQLLVEFEYLAGLDSPEFERQRRMDYQVSRLSARLRGDATTQGAEQELTALLQEWFALPPLTHDSATQMEARYQRALKSILDALV